MEQLQPWHKTISILFLNFYFGDIVNWNDLSVASVLGVWLGGVFFGGVEKMIKNSLILFTFGPASY